MDHHESEAFREYMNRLLDLLKKTLGPNRLSKTDLQKLLDKKDVNFTINLMILFPPLPEELEEFEAGLAQYLEHAASENGAEAGFLDGDLRFELTSSDLDFLKANGIKFNL
jgi:hypothetical protein